MSSTPKKRTKFKRNPNSDVGSGGDSSAPSSTVLLKSIKEPPRDFFPSKDDLAALLTVLFIACLVFVSCNFFVSRLSSRHPRPFCDTDADSLDLLSDVCEPCPRHGECRDGKLECLHGYRKHGRLCIEDGVINEAVNKLVEWLESHLCEANAKFLCDGIGIVWVCEILEENALMSMRNSGQSESWVVASRLRDHLLLPRERKNLFLWRKVEELVQEDSRIDRYPRLVKGDGKEVWEWQVEGSLSSSKEKRPASQSSFRKPMGVNSDQMYRNIENEPKPVVL